MPFPRKEPKRYDIFAVTMGTGSGMPRSGYASGPDIPSAEPGEVLVSFIGRAAHIAFKLMFGDFNGIQVFLYPLTLFWWIDSGSFLYAMTGLITIRRHYFPLSIFLLLFLYIMFLVLKNHSYIYSDTKRKEGQQSAFYEAVIEIHAYLLITLICFGLLYVFATFMGYYYSIKIPLKHIYTLAFRFFSISLILYYSIVYSWIQPTRNRNLSLPQARRLMRRFQLRHQLKFFSYLVMMILGIVFCAFIYSMLIEDLLLPFTNLIGISLKFFMVPMNNTVSLLYNVFIFGAAFILSNLLFSPLVAVFNHFLKKIHPLFLKYAKTTLKT
jgi:hypothetical protein